MKVKNPCFVKIQLMTMSTFILINTLRKGNASPFHLFKAKMDLTSTGNNIASSPMSMCSRTTICHAITVLVIPSHHGSFTC